MIIEMRTYLLKPGTTPSFEERFAEGLTYQTWARYGVPKSAH
jgi:hypothetical protein